MSFVPLTQAVTSGDASAVSAVLANGADVNERTGGGQTPLILATIFGHTHLIPLLLEAGADPGLRDNLGLNAIDWAQRRGATEAIDLFTQKRPRSKAQTEVAKPPQRTARQVVDETETPRAVSEEERSRRWIAGLKQRIAEQSQREVPDGPNIFRAQPAPATEPVEVQDVPQPGRGSEPELEPQIPSISQQAEEVAQKVDDVVPRVVEEVAQPVEGFVSRVEEPVAQVEESVPPRRSVRKRCPKCNAIYNSELVAYCAHHIVPLVDADEPPIISEPQKPPPVLFWMLIIITLSGSIVLASLITTYLYRINKAPTQIAASTTAPNAVQKGTPALGPELEGKVISLPIAECPLNGQEAIPGTVVVKVTVDKSGQVKSARASGGDWLLRGAATEAAMKSTFSPEKLRGRATEGTITYTFEP